MKKITLTILAASLVFSCGCSDKPKTIEEQAKVEIQTYFDAIDDGRFLSFLYESDIMEDRVFLDQLVNTIAKNLDEDIYNQGTITLRSLCEVVDKQAENIALYILLQDITEECKDDEETLVAIKKQAQISAKQIKETANIISAISYTKFETLHEHNAFRLIIAKIDKPTSKLIGKCLEHLELPMSSNGYVYTKIDESSVRVELDNEKLKERYGSTFFTSFSLKKNEDKWDLYDHNNELVVFKVDHEIKENAFKEIASTLYFDSISPEGQIDKAKKIQMLKLFDESLSPLKEKMEYEDFEMSLSQLMVFLFSAMYSM